MAILLIVTGVILTVVISSMQENILYEYLYFFGGMPMIIFGIIMIPYPADIENDPTKNYYCEKCKGTSSNSNMCHNPACPDVPCCGGSSSDCECNNN